MEYKSNKDLESRITREMSRFLKEQMGEQAEAVIARVLGDTIIVRFKGVLPPAEIRLSKDPGGARLINELKEKLIEKTKPLLESLIRDLTAADVVWWICIPALMRRQVSVSRFLH